MKIWRALFPAGLALAELLFCGNGAARAATDDVTWVRDPLFGEPAGRAGLRVPCGNYGVFHFDIAGYPVAAPAPAPLPPPPPPPISDPKDLCQNQDPDCVSGREIPAYYPSVGAGGVPAVQPVEPIPVFEENASFKRGSDPLRKTAWAPCQGGTCFDTRGVASGARPWVAVVDWDDPHGWSVGWTLREIVGTHPGPDPQHDYDLALLPFLTPPLLAFSGKGVTDVHVLAKLCEISEAVDGGASPPPSPST